MRSSQSANQSCIIRAAMNEQTVNKLLGLIITAITQAAEAQNKLTALERTLEQHQPEVFATYKTEFGILGKQSADEMLPLGIEGLRQALLRE